MEFRLKKLLIPLFNHYKINTMKKKEIKWKLQENIIDRPQIDILINFIKTTERYTQFTEVKKFEDAWSAWQGCKYSVFVNSGSSANLLILDILKELYHWQSGDEIIVPVVTWPTDISSVLQFGLKPVFVDVNLQDLAFDYVELEKKISSKTRAIFLTHLLGFPADIERIKKIIGKKNIELIEDCCESHGATINGEKIGNFGICSSFSFYWGHHISTVEGGMICTNNEEIYKLALLKRSHGLARELPNKYHSYYKKKYSDIDFRFLFLTTGFNVRNTELSAVLGLSQLKNLDNYIAIRNKNYKRFANILSSFPNFFVIQYREGISSFVLPFLLRDKNDKENLQKYLTIKEIESRPIVTGNLLKQPFLKSFSTPDNFPNANFIHTNGFYIGNNQFVNKQRLDYLKKVLDEFFRSQK